MYGFDSRIRYSETDSEGKLSLFALLNYFQDCSTFQSEDIGLGIRYLRERRRVWVLCSWQIEVERYPALCEEVEIGTFPYAFKGFLGSRNFFMRTKDGEYLARANSLWSLLDTDAGKPAVPSPEMLEGYRLEPCLDMDYAPRKVAVPDTGRRLEPLTVKKHHLDTNRHVNNGQYVNMGLELLPEGFPIYGLRAEYKKQAFLDDALYPYMAQTDRGYVVSLRDEKDAPCVNMEFCREKQGKRNEIC